MKDNAYSCIPDWGTNTTIIFRCCHTLQSRALTTCLKENTKAECTAAKTSFMRVNQPDAPANLHTDSSARESFTPVPASKWHLINASPTKEMTHHHLGFFTKQSTTLGRNSDLLQAAELHRKNLHSHCTDESLSTCWFVPAKKPG